MDGTIRGAGSLDVMVDVQSDEVLQPHRRHEQDLDRDDPLHSKGFSCDTLILMARAIDYSFGKIQNYGPASVIPGSDECDRRCS